MSKTRGIIAFALAIGILFSALLASTPSYAWIYFQKSTLATDFTVTDGYETEVKYGYYLESESEGAYTYTWNKWLDCVLTKENEYDSVDGSGSPIAFTGDFRFGKIDNVATLDPDNYVYLQFKFNVNSGNQAVLNLSYFTDSTNGNSCYTFYSGSRTTEGDYIYTKRLKSELGDLYTTLESIENERGTFIIHSYAFSDKPYLEENVANYGPSELAFKDYVEGTPTHIDRETTAGQNNITIDLTQENLTADSEGNVYLYVKIAPNLPAYVEAANYIINYMPCIIDFNIKASLIVSNQENG